MRIILKLMESILGKVKTMRPSDWYVVADLLSGLFNGELAARLWQFISDEVFELTGMRLDPAAPLTEASLTNALYERTGVQLRTLRDKQMIREDIEQYAAGLVSQKSGYTVRSLSDVNILKEDLQRAACAVLSLRLGIPAGVLPGDGEAFDAVAIKDRLLTWAKAELMNRVEGEVSLALGDIQQIGDLEALAVELNGQLAAMGSEEQFTARRLALAVSNKMAVNAVADYGRVAADMSKRTRRQLQLRDAQRKFRATHGNRQQYVPLGFEGVVTETPP